MTSFFQRAVSKLFGAAPAPQPSAQPASPAPAVPVHHVHPLHPAMPAAKPAPVALAARRPLIGVQGEVAGFEFRIDEAVLLALKQAGNSAAQAAHVAAVLVAARLVAMDGRIGFARLPAAWLSLASVPKSDAGTVIGVEFDPAAPPLSSEALLGIASMVEQFRAVGAKLAWGATHAMGSNPDFFLLRPASTQPLRALVATLASHTPGQRIPVIATDLKNVDELEMALHGGVHLATGSLGDSDTAKTNGKTPSLAPEVGRLALLIGKLAAGAETAAIVGEIKGDVGVSVRLLQRMNSASYAHLGGVSSIDQAVMLLGRNDLHRWLSLMLMQFAGSRQLSSALQEVALWRARFVELLAQERGEPEPGRFFTLGLGSMLGLILKIPPTEVARTLSLPPEGLQALLSHGPWYGYLRTALEVEDGSASEASAVVEGFTSAARVQELSSQAWTWAAENAMRSGATSAAG